MYPIINYVYYYNKLCCQLSIDVNCIFGYTRVNMQIDGNASKPPISIFDENEIFTEIHI